MNISGELLGELVKHALDDPANEVCGVVAVEPAGELVQDVAQDAGLVCAARASS